jgi:hypothetical protein
MFILFIHKCEGRVNSFSDARADFPAAVSIKYTTLAELLASFEILSFAAVVFPL